MIKQIQISCLRKLSYWYSFLLFLVYTVTSLLTCHSSFDDDTPYICKYGELILKNGLFVHNDPLGQLHTKNFIYQQWGTAIVFHLLNKLTDNSYGIYCLLVIEAIMFLYLLRNILYKITDNYRLSCLFPIFIYSIISFEFNLLSNERPELLSFDIMLFVIYEIIVLLQDNKKYHFICIFLAAVLQINMHCAVWPMLIVVLLPFLCDFKCNDIFHTLFCRKKLYVLNAIICVLFGSICSPYGLDAMTYVFRIYNNNQSSLATVELMPTFMNSFSDGLYLFWPVYIMIFIIILVHSTMHLPLNMTYVFFAIGGIILGISAIRYLSYMYLFVAFLPLYEFSFLENNHVNGHLFISDTKIVSLYMIGFVLLFLWLLLYKSSLMKDDLYRQDNQVIVDYFDENVSKDAHILSRVELASLLEYNDFHPFGDCRNDVLGPGLNDGYDYYADYVDLFRQYIINVQSAANMIDTPIESIGTDTAYNLLNQYDIDYIVTDCIDGKMFTHEDVNKTITVYPFNGDSDSNITAKVCFVSDVSGKAVLQIIK